MKAFIEWLQQFSNGLTETQSNIIATIIVIGCLWLLRRILIQSLARLQGNLAMRYNLRKGIVYGISIIGALSIAFIWSHKLESFATFLGLLSAGLAIAFKDPIANMAGWYFILVQKSFKVGDRIQCAGHIGDVIDINLFQFTIIEVGNWVAFEQSTGRIIHIPNAKIFSTSIANYNAGMDYIWHEIPVLITFESNWRKAKEYFTTILEHKAPPISEKAKRNLQDASGEYLIYYKKLTPIIYTSVEDSGVLLTLRYLCAPKQRRGSTQEIWEAILDVIYEHTDIDLAYPTRRTVMLSNAPKRPAGSGDDKLTESESGEE